MLMKQVRVAFTGMIDAAQKYASIGGGGNGGSAPRKPPEKQGGGRLVSSTSRRDPGIHRSRTISEWGGRTAPGMCEVEYRAGRGDRNHSFDRLNRIASDSASRSQACTARGQYAPRVWIASGQTLERRQFCDAWMRDAHCTNSAPRRLERHLTSPFAVTWIDAIAVTKEDHGAIACVSRAVTAVVSTSHVNARLVHGADRRAAELLLPQAVAPANALSDGATRASKFEAAVPIRHWKPKASALCVGRTKLLRAAPSSLTTR